MSGSENHFARATELHRALHEVTLPGASKPVLLRDLPVFEFAVAGSLPISLAAKLSGDAGAKRELTDQDVRDYAEWVKHAVSLVVVRPQCAPPDEWGNCQDPELLDPTLLPAEAQRFLISFAKGEIDAAGRPVVRFRGEARAAPDSGANRENVSSAA
jgi:hypothetical protein